METDSLKSMSEIFIVKFSINQMYYPGAPNFSKSKDIFGFPEGLDRKFCIASMGHLRVQGGTSPPGFGAYGLIQAFYGYDLVSMVMNSFLENFP